MAKCKICGEELGDKKVCPFCGTDNKPSEVYENKNLKKENTSSSQKNVLEEIDKEKTELIDSCARAVVKLTCDFGDFISTGTGFFVEGDYIVTNCHVVTNEFGLAPKHIIMEYSEKFKLADRPMMEILYANPDDDIAILTIRYGTLSNLPTRLKISKDEQKQGELVFTIGNPLHYKFTYMEGRIANPTYKSDYSKSGYTCLQTTLVLNHGNSGGPLFNVHGEVVGITTFAELMPNQCANYQGQEVSGYGFCIDKQVILDALEKIK